MGWQVSKRRTGFRPRIQAMPPEIAPNERWSTDLCRTRPGRDRRTTALTMSNERVGSTFLRYGSIRDALLGKRDSAIGANFTASTEIVGTGRLVSQSAASFFR